MTALVPSQVVLNEVDVLAEEVNARRIFSTDVNGDVLGAVFALHVLDVHCRTVVADFAVVADAVVRCTELVAPFVVEARVQFSYERVGEVAETIRRVVEIESSSRVAILVVECVDVLIAKSKFVLVVDVPVNTCKNVGRLAFNVALAKRILELATSELVVVVEDLLSLVNSQESLTVVARIVRRRISVLVAFNVNEEEQFVLDGSTRNVTTIGESALSGERVLLVELLVPTTVEVLVVVVCVSRSVEGVATLLGYGVDTTTGEA